MSLTVHKLNADTSFLLAFAPDFTLSKSTKRFPGAFTVLLDPWLRGQSSLLHPSFQVSHLTTRPAVTSLADIDHDIDLIIISQDKPDHCHQETLCSWPRTRKVNILATPAAAKKIKSWAHFDETCIHEILPYNPADDDTLVRVTIPSYTRGSRAGEITFANLAPRRDLTGLHNAIAITYRPPGSVLTPSTLDTSKTFLSNQRSQDQQLITPPESPSDTHAGAERPAEDRSTFRSRVRSASTSLRSLSRPRSRTPASTKRRRQDSAVHHPDTPPRTPCPQSTLSCIYTPHGVSRSTIEPYIHHHLAPNSALPLTLLIHSMVMERNPWYLGGVVAAGAPGGVRLIKVFEGRVKHWLRAHDEKKDNQGLSVKWIKSERYELEQVHNLLERAQYLGVELADLKVGAERRFTG